MFSKALDSRNQEEQPCQLPARKKKKTLFRNPFVGSLKFEARQLQPGGLGGRAGGRAGCPPVGQGAAGSKARRVAVASNGSGGRAIRQTWV